MLSRRSIRVKAMQVLFAKNRDGALKLSEALKLYWTSIEYTFEMFLLNLYVLTEITKVSVEDEKTRKSKFLQNEADHQFSAKIFNNKVISALSENKGLNARYAKLGFTDSVDKDIIQKIYSYFSKEESYMNYWNQETSDDQDVDMLLELYRFCRSNEFFNELMTDHYYLWESEKSIVIGAVKKVLKLTEMEDNFYLVHYPDKITTRDFGEELLKQTEKLEDSLNEMIVPKLKNWDKDRVTILDMILIKMAITEFLEFETIPPKVTLNEYVELSKNYSTEKSKEFVNGVLDKILKELEDEGKINKTVKE
jgi:N utilization substance protein B